MSDFGLPEQTEAPYFMPLVQKSRRRDLKSDLQKGDYVLATKWHDGDSRDQWCCGLFEGMTEHDNPRYEVVDSEGKLFRNNGFKRCEKIHPTIGKYLVEKSQYISAVKISLWEYIASEIHNTAVENYDYDQSNSK